MDPDVETIAIFLEDEVMCRFGVLKYILIDNDIEWSTEFDQLCKNYGIAHQYMTPQWPRCNKMVKRLTKTLKHGLTILFVTFEHPQDWDEQLPNILFGYCYEVKTNIKFSPHMLLIGQMPRLKADNFQPVGSNF